MSVILELKKVGVAYHRGRNPFGREKYWALKDVSFTLKQGETLGVIGRNGVGKSTLLKLVAGIIAQDRGELISSAARASLLSLQVGFSPQLTGRENAILSGMLLGESRAHIEAAMDRIIRFSELNDFIDEPVGSYSMGMKARLGFSVAMQVKPDILLIDEVLGVGDAEFKKKSADEIKSLIQSECSVILVSHNTNVMRTLCDRVVWLEDGKTKLQGKAADVIDAYENLQ